MTYWQPWFSDFPLSDELEDWVLFTSEEAALAYALKWAGDENSPYARAERCRVIGT